MTRHDDDLLTIEDVAAEKNIPVATLRHMRQNGRGPRFFKIDRRLYIQRSDLNRWIADLRAQGLTR